MDINDKKFNGYLDLKVLDNKKQLKDLLLFDDYDSD